MKYYVNDKPEVNGYREVHDELCNWLTYVINRTPIGEHPNCAEAMKAAEKIYPGEVDGCRWCCDECNTH